MEILKSQEEYFKAVIENAKESSSVLISSFGLWAGIMSNGYQTKYPCASRDALEIIQNNNIYFIVGRPQYIPCDKDKCPHCLEKWKEQCGRIHTTLQGFGIKYRISDTYHAKYCLFKNGTSIVGGMNFTTSNWTDYMFVSKDKELHKQLELEFRKQWGMAKNE